MTSPLSGETVMHFLKGMLFPERVSVSIMSALKREREMTGRLNAHGKYSNEHTPNGIPDDTSQYTTSTIVQLPTRLFGLDCIPMPF